jgi:hypothetical protein
MVLSGGADPAKREGDAEEESQHRKEQSSEHTAGTEQQPEERLD